MSIDPMTIISLHDVQKQYRLNGNTVTAVQGISLSISRGEFVAFSGPSGSGKSTLFSLIAAMSKPTAGRVVVTGQDVTEFDNAQGAILRRKMFGFVFQSFNLMPVLSAFENIELPLLLTRMASQERRARVMELAERLELTALLDHRPGAMSGGQRQRVAIARALVTRPQIIIADEPTANLDSKIGHMVLELARERCRQDDVTFVFSSHDPAMVVQADRVITLHDGRVANDKSTHATGAAMRLAANERQRP